MLAALVFVTVSPIGLRPHTIVSVGLDRSVAFFLAGAVFAIAYPKRWMSLALFLVASSFAIEILQELSPTRHARLDDALVKAVGAVAGIIAGKIALTVRRGILSRRPAGQILPPVEMASTPSK
ncbi:VanZ family protein [Pararhizobium sp. LjRoot255]|uniref:VanZ family protein n=1 Tax=Pararhizobium sp. LjRoot255 TaxID=3342298 RepID=UPI003F4F99FA